jgi:branched-chain amino acid transport system permease protein
MARTLLPTNPRARAALFAVASTAGLLVITQFVMPGRGGGQRGTPTALLFTGLVTGLVTSLYAVGLVLVYRTLRIINFSQGLIGSAGAQICVNCLVYTKVPFVAALPISLIVSAVLGALVGLFMLRFFNASRLFLSVVTIVGAISFGQVLVFIERLPFWPKFTLRTRDQLDNISHPERLLPFRGFHFKVGDFPLSYGFEHLFAIEMSVLALIAVGVFLRYTKAGTAVRALAENPDRASLLGIGVAGLSVLVWVVAGTLDGVADVTARMSGINVGAGFIALLIPFAAVIIARFQSIPVAVAACVGLSVLRSSWQWGLAKDNNLFYAVVFVVILVALLTQRSSFKRADQGADVGWAGTDEPRPIPAELRSITGLRLARWGFIAAGLLIVVFFPFVITPKRMQLVGGIAIYGIAALSLVVLTGWAGQVSLGQWALLAIGAVVSGALTHTVGLTFWLAVPLVAAFTAGIAVLIGLPALRIKGLFLLVSTFSFAVVVSLVLFNKRYFGWLLPNNVKRPTLFFINFEDERSMYFLCMASLALAIWAVVNLRRSRVGRVLIALRDNESNVQAFGVSAFTSKLMAFAVSGALAGFAGALFAHQQRGVSGASFGADRSVLLFLAVVIGGVSSPAGALLGSFYYEIVNNFLTTPSQAVLAAFFTAGGPLLIVFAAPGGFISLVNAVRDSILRIIAQRRRIVVPSLFADYDADVVARQLIPLSEPESTVGLAALPVDDRYVLESDLYQAAGDREGAAIAAGREDAAALGAAARSLADTDDAAMLEVR